MKKLDADLYKCRNERVLRPRVSRAFTRRAANGGVRPVSVN